MGGFFAWLVVSILQIIPFWRILPRAGVQSPWALVAALPLGALALLWVLAYKRWPQDGVPDRFR